MEPYLPFKGVWNMNCLLQNVMGIDLIYLYYSQFMKFIKQKTTNKNW